MGDFRCQAEDLARIGIGALQCPDEKEEIRRLQIVKQSISLTTTFVDDPLYPSLLPW